MKKKKIYISLPVSHFALVERINYANKVENALSNFYEVVNPFKNGVDTDADWKTHMRRDLQLLLTCDVIFMCEGWEKSKGCKLEFDVATSSGLEVVFERVRTIDILDSL